MFSRSLVTSTRLCVRGLATAAAPGSYLPKAVVQERVINVVKSIRSVPRDFADTEASFGDLGFDSLVRKELWLKLEDEFCVPVASKDAESTFSTVSSVVQFFSSHPKAR